MGLYSVLSAYSVRRTSDDVTTHTVTSSGFEGWKATYAASVCWVLVSTADGMQCRSMGRCRQGCRVCRCILCPVVDDVRLTEYQRNDAGADSTTVHVSTSLRCTIHITAVAGCTILVSAARGFDGNTAAIDRDAPGDNASASN